jgi:polysaccharide export outer membrane protein
MRNAFVVAALLSVLLFSCKPQEKLPNYLEVKTDTLGKNKTVQIPELLIQKNDLLSIQITSQATKPEVDMVFNQGGIGQPQPGYLVDIYGNIEHHWLGTIHAEGLTKLQLAEEIKKRVTQPVELLVKPSVTIRFLNFKVSVLGEVNRQGSIPVQGERITILEAISLAGDITQYGKKHTVQVIREVNGIREQGTIDLSSDKLFESPYYNLLQNDVVIVHPGRIKSKTAEQAMIAQKTSIALSVAAVAASLISVFRSGN